MGVRGKYFAALKMGSYQNLAREIFPRARSLRGPAITGAAPGASCARSRGARVSEHSLTVVTRADCISTPRAIAREKFARIVPASRVSSQESCLTPSGRVNAHLSGDGDSLAG